MIVTIDYLMEAPTVMIQGVRKPAKPERCYCLSCKVMRLKQAWMVASGKADAFVWPIDEEKFTKE